MKITVGKLIALLSAYDEDLEIVVIDTEDEEGYRKTLSAIELELFEDIREDNNVILKIG